ncbi:toll/interleukin-1 receptor domain-containing protein [Aquimarina sp. W85]|uniref:toll/interleukin-1 receptor domain-containing protein n=1 Tax=Aquimarina rhodophyticola TaxID=3342246 RepID=UPI003672772A
MKEEEYIYDIALSFAGEDRNYVEKVAFGLKKKNIRVFYDMFEEASLWGKNLYNYLSDIYQRKARFTVLFISKSYNEKLWTNHERVSMQARAFQESREYILPARFDNTEIPGILNTVGYIDLQIRTPDQLVDLIEKKILKEQTYLSKKLSKLSTLIGPKPFIFTLKTVDVHGKPLKGCHIILMADNATYLEGYADDKGLAHFIIRTKNNYTVLIANASCVSRILHNIDPKIDIEVELQSSDTVSSMVFYKSGKLPGMTSSIQPTINTKGMLQLYADNIAIEGGVEQPFAFELNKPISLEDNKGNFLHLTFRFYKGRIALIDFDKN